MKCNKVALIPCLLFVFSCYEHEVERKKSVEVIDGRLAFSSMDALNLFMGQAHSKNFDEFMLDIRKFEMEGFQSLLPTFDADDEKK